MLIANPIYDVVFKYFLEDNKLAKLFIGVLLDVTILDLEFLPQEVTVKVERPEQDLNSMSLLRLDFKAKISDENGSIRVVLIELQKTKSKADMFRFRNYLGAQYQNPENSITLNNVRVPIPIISIYFIGFSLETHKSIPVIRVKRNYTDICTGEILEGGVSFIENLTHDTIIVQLAALKQRRRFEIEKILSIFDIGTEKFIEVNEYDYPDAFKEFLTRLKNVMENPKVIRDLVYEQELSKEIAEYYYEAKELKGVIADLNRQKEDIIRQNEDIVRQNEDVVKQKEDIISKEKQLLLKSVQYMKQSGLSVAQIAEILDKTEIEIQETLA